MLSPSKIPIPPSPASSDASFYSRASGNDRSRIQPLRTPPDLEVWPTRNPLVGAILSGDVARVRLLAQQGHTVAESDGWALYDACVRGTDMMQALLLNPDIDFNLELPGNNGRTLHHLLRTPAAQFQGGKVNVIQLLLLAGADPFQRDNLGDTALHLLSGPVHWDNPSDSLSLETQQREFKLEIESLDILRYLLRRMHTYVRRATDDKPLDSVNNYGNTALVVSMLYGNTEASKLLLESGARRDITGELKSLSTGPESEGPDPETTISNYHDITDGLSDVEQYM